MERRSPFYKTLVGSLAIVMALAAVGTQLRADETPIVDDLSTSGSSPQIQTLTYEQPKNTSAEVQLVDHRHYYGGRGGYGFSFGYGGPYSGFSFGYGPRYVGYGPRYYGYSYYRPRYYGYSYYRPDYYGYSYYRPYYYGYSGYAPRYWGYSYSYAPSYGYYGGGGGYYGGGPYYGGYSYAPPSYYYAPGPYYGSWGYGSAYCE